MDNNYKIYKYTNKINQKVYIGQTRQSIQHRAMGKGWGYKKCPHFFSAIKKYGWDNFECEILYENLSREDADRLEKEYILYFKNLNICYNIDNGGKSKGVRQISLKRRKQISNSMKGKNTGSKNGMYQKTVVNKNVYVFNDQQQLINTICSIKKCSKILSIHPSNLSNLLIKYVLKIGNYFYSSSKTIEKPIKIYKTLAVGVSQYDLNGNLIKHYNNTIEVTKNGLVNDNLLRTHRNNPWIYKDYIWVFDDLGITDKQIIINCAKPTEQKYKPRIKDSNLKNTIIYQYDLFGNFIKQYDCFTDAIKEIGVTYNSLKRLHHGSWVANDFIWATSHIDKKDLIIEAYSNISQYTSKYPIFQFDLEGNLIRAFISQSEIKKQYKLSRDTIMKYINNGPFIYKGYIWVDLNQLCPINTIQERSKNNISKTKE